MSHEQIVAALEDVRAGNASATHVSELETYLINVLMDEGPAAVGAILLNLEGMDFALVDQQEDSPTTVIRSSHDHNALIVEVFAVEDIASISIIPEDADVAAPPPGHEWFYDRWAELIDADIDDPGSLDDPDRTVYLVASFEADVMNGGIGQYLANSEGAFAAATIEALKSIGARRTATCLENAARLKQADESWDELWVRADPDLDDITETLIADAEYLALLTATKFGEADDDETGR